ncbi:MAG: prephenate dehydrogenase [Chloroflexi bacterium]|nr:prephenate dehydrogenase [Chloroflexota bacterium]
MQEPDFPLAHSRIVIVGLGLMGGSMALGLKGKCAALYGVDTDEGTRDLAVSQGIVSRAASDLTSLLPETDVLILSTPVPAILSLLGNLPSLTGKPCIVMDLGSTKRMIVEAMANLPELYDPIGGHPICGKEKLSMANAEAAIYRDAPFILTPLARTSARALSAARSVIEALGAWPLIMEAEEHDRMLAFTSHLPYLLASALVRSVPRRHDLILGPGFKSVSRLAGTPSSMMLGVLETNRDFVRTALREMMEGLSEMESLLNSEDFTKLEAILNETRDKHQVYKI